MTELLVFGRSKVSAESVKGLLSMAWIAVVPVEFSYARHRR
jgi:hypothetical protein